MFFKIIWKTIICVPYSLSSYTLVSFLVLDFFLVARCLQLVHLGLSSLDFSKCVTLRFLSNEFKLMICPYALSLKNVS